ncbi:MAG: NFACT family protein [Defluviitaleaceae bacterium]|nr:NFACT family protein [Defluviitaleaceae bacterium]
MPQDGTVISSIVHELSKTIIGGRIDKITQPEPDEIQIAIRAGGANHRLLMTTQAMAPRLHLTNISKQSPMQAPMFCMVLRKHISAGRIVEIRQPGFERIVELHIEALNEMGDRSIKTLLIEIMGKHSNIMLLDPDTNKVIDAIKHVPPSVSSVRTILPGSEYNRPPGSKANPLMADEAFFVDAVFKDNSIIQKALYLNYAGLSPILASEICIRANVLPETHSGELGKEEQARLYRAFLDTFEQIKAGDFSPHMYYDLDANAVDITALSFIMYNHFNAETYASPSKLQEAYYAKRDTGYRISQKTADLRKLISTHQERCIKKALMYDKTLKDIEGRDELRVKGELLTAYMHQIERGAETITLENFYDDNNPIKIALSHNLTPTENAQRYFKQYNKQKRTFLALREQILQNQEDIAYLDSVSQAMETVITEADIAEIRAELAEGGFVKRKYAIKGHGKNGNKNVKKQIPVKPLRFTSSDGFEIYVGKNNTQNDHLTLRQAKNHDIWMHTKDIAGSHVIIITGGSDVPERTILEGANLAAFYSKGRNSSQVPVDYVQKKYVRKPTGAKPGFVIYDRHRTVYVTPKEPAIVN